MKRYLVFSGNRYYPDGGWDDFQGSFDTAEEANAVATKLASEGEYIWSHWLDLETAEKHTVVSCWG